MVRVPPANRATLRLPAVKSEGSPVTVKYIPSPCVGLDGGAVFGAMAWFERLGKPVVVTANIAGEPTNIVAVFTLVICGPSFTFNVKGCVAEPVEALAVSVKEYCPPEPIAGVPLMVAGFPGVKVRPRGNVSAKPMVPVLAAKSPECLATELKTMP